MGDKFFTFVVTLVVIALIVIVLKASGLIPDLIDPFIPPGNPHP